jgi:metallo-beta-lactamase class B
VKVDKVLRDGETVSLGGVTLKAHLTPGHSRGCTSWGQTVQHQGKPYELLVFCSATVAANRITPPLQYPGIVEDYRGTFAKAKAMKVDVFLAPHPEFFDMAGKRAKLKDGAPNPFINPSEFKPFIEKLEAAFEKLGLPRFGGHRT